VSGCLHKRLIISPYTSFCSKILGSRNQHTSCAPPSLQPFSPPAASKSPSLLLPLSCLLPPPPAAPPLVFEPDGNCCDCDLPCKEPPKSCLEVEPADDDGPSSPTEEEPLDRCAEASRRDGQEGIFRIIAGWDYRLCRSTKSNRFKYAKRAQSRATRENDTE
jgi:hypothetical protein